MLGVIGFVNLVLAIAFEIVRSTLWVQIRAGANETGVYSYVNPHLVTLETIFWIVFVFSMIGAVVAYVLGAHKEEYEEYERPYNPGRF